MSPNTEIKFKKHGAANAGGRKKRDDKYRRPTKHCPGDMTNAEVDQWFEEAKKMPLNTFFSEPTEAADSPAPKAELVIPPGMRGSRHSPANNTSTAANNISTQANTPKPEAERATAEAAKPMMKVETSSPKAHPANNGKASPARGLGASRHNPANNISTERVIAEGPKPTRAILLAEQSLAAAEAAKFASQKMLQASEDAIKAAKAQLLLAQIQVQPQSELQDEEEEEEL
ncbi:hypothetical protein QBC32DRAFT_393480 [Pseudoneurospora amorphoporcata]|uniref:Uncharacterized protein n=1 Tax=Pseudoneurospora amorphoporcata TaxID=241081 RepID=A0AAN6SF97_9PEZI|nr:hypothetical protein QBC32DRAFT_393480 [Pseudoneurospora amorphoporcata]